MTTIPIFDLNLDHMNTLLKLVGNYSETFSRVSKFVQLQKQLFDMGRKSIYSEFPVRTVFDLSLGVSLHLNIQNFNMTPPKHEVFEINNSGGVALRRTPLGRRMNWGGAATEAVRVFGLA